MAGWTQKALDKLLRDRAGELILTRVEVAREQTTSKSMGRRADLENRYFRSRWEANVARLLNLWQQLDIVQAWEYESEEFEFHKIKRGVRFYKIDFKIRFSREPSQWVYWEVKGYLDGTSKTKLKRMAKFYPHIQIQIIASTQYYALQNQWSGRIPEWERGDPSQQAVNHKRRA